MSLHIHIKLYNLNVSDIQTTWTDPEGGGAARGVDPLKNHKHLGFLSNTGPDPL